jgi:hypothetical protein
VASKKKKKQRNRQRQSFAPASSAAPVQTEAGGTSSPGPAPAPAPPAKPTYATGITGPRRATAGATAATGTIDIDARVPYFASDLRRVLATASVMIVLIVAGSLLIK